MPFHYTTYSSAVHCYRATSDSASWHSLGPPRECDDSVLCDATPQMGGSTVSMSPRYDETEEEEEESVQASHTNQGMCITIYGCKAGRSDVVIASLCKGGRSWRKVSTKAEEENWQESRLMCSDECAFEVVLLEIPNFLQQVSVEDHTYVPKSQKEGCRKPGEAGHS